MYLIFWSVGEVWWSIGVSVWAVCEDDVWYISRDHPRPELMLGSKVKLLDNGLINTLPHLNCSLHHHTSQPHHFEYDQRQLCVLQLCDLSFFILFRQTDRQECPDTFNSFSSRYQLNIYLIVTLSGPRQPYKFQEYGSRTICDVREQIFIICC